MQYFKTSYLWFFARLFLTILSTLALTYVTLHSTNPSSFSLVIFSLLFIISGYGSIKLAYNKNIVISTLKLELNENRFEPFHLFIAPFAFIGLFSLICFNLYALDSKLFITNFPLTGWAWITFALDQSSRAILLDLFETYQIHLSNINYIQNFWLSSFILLFKTILTFTFWKFIFNLTSSWKSFSNAK